MSKTDQELDALLDKAMQELATAARRVVADQSIYNLSLLHIALEDWDKAKLEWIENKRKLWATA